MMPQLPMHHLLMHPNAGLRLKQTGDQTSPSTEKTPTAIDQEAK